MQASFTLIKPDSAQQVEGDVYIGDSTLNFYNTKKTDRSGSLTLINQQSKTIQKSPLNVSPGTIKIGSKRSLKLLMDDLVPNSNFVNRHHSIFIQPGSTKSLLPNLGILGSERRFGSIAMASPHTMREIEKKDRAARSIFLRANELA
jgi:hypothetical protein